MVGSSGCVLGLGKLSLPRAEQPRESAGRQGGRKLQKCNVWV